MCIRDRLWGAGTAVKIFDGVVNLKVAMNAFQELVDGINAEKAELETMAKAVTAKYSGTVSYTHLGRCCPSGGPYWGQSNGGQNANRQSRRNGMRPGGNHCPHGRQTGAHGLAGQNIQPFREKP